MKPKLIAVALLLALASAARADFLPITLTAVSYTEDMVIEHTAAAVPNGTATTASMDGGTGNNGYSWYEQGYNSGAPGTGLPTAGSTFASAAFPTHHYTMAASYTAHNAALIDASHSATLTPASPAAFGALSLLTSAGNGPVTIAYTVHHADTTTESGNVASKDWFGNSPVAFTANGRADVQSGTLDNVNNNNPRLYSADIALANRTSPVTSIDLSWDASNTGSGAAAVFALSGQAAGPVTLGQTIQFGLTLTNINNPAPPDLVTNSDGSITITAGGGDTYGAPDSFTYAYQQVTGDFDIHVRVINVASTVTDHSSSIAPKGSLMVRAGLGSTTNDFQINATPVLPFQVNGHIETIGRILVASDTDDLPGRGLNYGPGNGVTEAYQGDTTDFGYCTYPDVWLRVQRQGERLMSYFATANTTDAPAGWASNPGSTNGWQLLGIVHAGANFPKTLYVGISTVAHNGGNPNGTGLTAATYADYGPTASPPSNPSVSGAPAIAGTGPGPFPNTKVLAANFDASIAADGLGYPPDIVQSSQGAGQQIIWNSGGFGGVARDIIANISGQTPDGFCFARYQAGAFDFLLSPRDPVAALQNLGPYTNPLRERYSTGGTNVPASQAWAPSPNYGFVYTTVHKNGQQWNDTSPFFYAATYVQLDGVATGQGYDMIGGHFRGAQFYTRSTKLVTGSPTDPSSDLGNLQRCAIPVSIGWFPYDQGWKAGYFDSPQFNTVTAGIPYWKRGNGWGLNSGTALTGYPTAGGQALYNSPSLLTWLETPDGSGTFTGLARLSLSGVNSVNDGMLFTIGNDENNSKRGPSASNAALSDGTGWYVAVRDMETSKPDPTVYASGGGSDAGASFSFVYIPYNADNLIGGHIATNGTTIKGTGSFSVSHLSTGRYALTITGKTGTNGVLLLQNTGYLANQPAGLTNVVDNSYLSYEYGGTNTPANAFIIETRYVDDSGGGEGVVKLRDAEFNFVYVDFLNPVAPPGTVPPVLSITPASGNHVIVSWSNGPGFMLQKNSSLVSPGSWTDVGTSNPSAPIATSSSPLYFRVRSP